MSKLYDDLKREKGEGESDGLDLFAYAANKAKATPPPTSLSPEILEPAAAEIEIPKASVEPLPPPAHETRELLSKREPVKSSKPLYGGLSPLAGVRPPPHEEDRRTMMIAAIAVGGLLVMAFLAVGIVRGLSRSKPVSVAVNGAEPVDVVKPTPVDVKPAPRVVRPVATAAVKEVELGGKGMVVSSEGNEKIVVFETGVFASGVKLSSEGKAMLLAVGRQLATRAKSISITVVGCTDNVSVSGKKGYKDNQALGLVRATTAAEVLRTSSGVPAGAFSTVSYGEKWSPFPNDTAAHRAQNRTVVLRIKGW